MMGDLNRALENAAVLLVVILSAPLAALLFAVLTTYFILLFNPQFAEDPGTVWTYFGASFAAIYAAICFFAVQRK